LSDPAPGGDNRTMANATIQGRGQVMRILHRDLDLRAFFDEADRALARLVPFDSSCWLSTDPATHLPTSHFSREFSADHLLQLAANEFLEEDVNKFCDIGAAPRPVGILSEVTGGDTGASRRYVTVLAPNGYEHGDELRAVFREGEAIWGCLAIHRRTSDFEAQEAALIAMLGPLLAHGIRRAILRTAVTHQIDTDAAGLILLAADDTLESITTSARRWLGELEDVTAASTPVPLIVTSVAHRARVGATDVTGELASSLVPRRSGGWLRIDASLLDADPDGRVAVILHPAREPEVASVIVAAYGLSAREREVTGLVLQGRSTEEIATHMYVSAYTVQDHLKAIFDKVGVRSRRELVAELFLQQCAPRLRAGIPPGRDGWFSTNGDGSDARVAVVGEA
jgi:DNA-binding CsgD family transcriptional regulator